MKELKKTLYIGLPIIIGNLSQIAMGLVDSAMVGSIHSTQLAASALVNNILAIPMIFGMGLTMAISPLVAASLGSNDKSRPLRILYNAFWFSFLIVLLIALIVHFGSNIVYHLGQDTEVALLSESYLKWMNWSMIPMILFLAIKQFADGLEKTRWPLILSLLAIPVNVFINYIFIFGKYGAPRMELDGAGVGTMVSRITMFIAMAIIVMNSKSFAPYRTIIVDQFKFRKDRLKEIWKIGMPSALQYGMESGAFAFSGIMVGWLGSEQQAAHQIALSLAATTFMVSLGLSAAGSIRVGNSFGRRAWAEVRKIGMTVITMSVVFGGVCALFFIFFKDSLPYLFNDEKVVVYYASMLLFYAAIFQISDSAQAILVGLLRGIQDVKIPTFIVAFAYWGVGIPAGYILAFPFGLESRGIWIGFLVGLSFSAIMLFIRFRKLTDRNM